MPVSKTKDIHRRVCLLFYTTLIIAKIVLHTNFIGATL